MYPRRVWRVRLWVRVMALLVGVGGVFLAIALAFEFNERGMTENPALSIGVTVFLIVVIPWLAWWPVLVLERDGSIFVRAWAGNLRNSASELKAAAMTSYGLRLEFEGARPITSPVFQATMSFGLPRFVEFFEAVSGLRVLSPARRRAAESSLTSERVPDSVIFRTHDASVWRSWLADLRYFRAVTATPGDDDGDKFELALRCRDGHDIESRMALFGDEIGPLGFSVGHLGRGRIVFLIDESPTPGLRFLVYGNGNLPLGVTEEDVQICQAVEQRIDDLGWSEDVDRQVLSHLPTQAVVTPERYPELF